MDQIHRPRGSCVNESGSCVRSFESDSTVKMVFDFSSPSQLFVITISFVDEM